MTGFMVPIVDIESAPWTTCPLPSGVAALAIWRSSSSLRARHRRRPGRLTSRHDPGPHPRVEPAAVHRANAAPAMARFPAAWRADQLVLPNGREVAGPAGNRATCDLVGWDHT
jgi:hypothetical protein